MASCNGLPRPSSRNLLDLPEELILGLARYLSGVDVIRLSHCNKLTLQIFQSGHVWQQILSREHVVEERSLQRFSQSHESPEKLSYILHRRLRLNWQRSQYKVASIPLHEQTKVGYDQNHLVVMSQLSLKHKMWNVRAWDISCQGLQPVVVQFNWSTRLMAEFDLDLANILVAKGCALLCFSGKGNDTPQEVIACDIRDVMNSFELHYNDRIVFLMHVKNDFHELWRDQIHDWGQFELPRLFGNGLYRFNLLANKIEVFHVRTFQKMFCVTLVEEMRYPRGDISGDGRHLVIPGKLSHNNSPAISVWTLQTGSQRFLLPNHAFCPYRWFEKTAVRNGLVYGLLNRRCLLIWDAESAECLKNVALTDSSPGDQEPVLAFNFLTVSKGLVATINAHPSNVSVLNCRGEGLGVLQSGSLSRLKVCDVLVNEYCLLVRMVNYANPGFEVVSYPLESDGVSLGAGLECTRIDLAPVQDCVLHEWGITPTKLINFARNELLLYDFL